jgi:nucleoside 2-deoxyribosyltransferase
MNDGPHAFVLMPFDDSFASIYDELIRPALEDAGYEVSRADSFLDQQNILRDIVGRIATADLVVAELTALNPNVMYELGLCHALRTPAVLITQTLEAVPFDLRSYRIVTYSERFNEALKLRETLTEIATRHRDESIAFGSPVLDFLAVSSDVRVAPPSMVHERELGTATVTSDIDDDDIEGGILDFVVGGQEAFEELHELLTFINEETVRLGESIKKRTERLALLQDESPGDVKQVVIVLAQGARDMTQFADAVDARIPELEHAIDKLGENFSNFVATLELTSPDEVPQAVQLRDTWIETERVTGESLEAVRTFRNSVTDLPELSRDMKRAKRRVESTLTKQITAFERVEALASRIASLLDAEISRWQTEQGDQGRAN